ncbi:MAG: response regulator transcription factor [Chloroflexi bacterium]|nr:response regulator transcription factor [Chloroflexota bacterium]MCH8102309.1 response regulator transcription factor [Chloroflexota bacterium]
MLRVLLVDDQELFRDVVRSMFSGSNDFEVVAEAEDGLDAVNAYPELNPDLVLMDVQMARMNGLEATREILKGDPDACVVITSMRSEPEYQRLALDMGAVGFIPKRELSLGSLRAILGGAMTAAA